MIVPAAPESEARSQAQRPCAQALAVQTTGLTRARDGNVAHELCEKDRLTGKLRRVPASRLQESVDEQRDVAGGTAGAVARRSHAACTVDKVGCDA